MEKLESVGNLLVPMDDENARTQHLRRTPSEIKACERAFVEDGVWEGKRRERLEKVWTVGQRHANREWFEKYNKGKRSKFFENGELRNEI